MGSIARRPDGDDTDAGNSKMLSGATGLSERALLPEDTEVLTGLRRTPYITVHSSRPLSQG